MARTNFAHECFFPGFRLHPCDDKSHRAHGDKEANENRSRSGKRVDDRLEIGRCESHMFRINGRRETDACTGED